MDHRRLGASDFTHCTSLGITINGQLFPAPDLPLRADLLEWETGTILLFESFESLSAGLFKTPYRNSACRRCIAPIR